MRAISIDKVRILLEIPEMPTDLIQEALTVAGEDQKYPDGFKALAQLGTTCINTCFLEMGYKGSLRREINSDISTKYNSSVYRASVAKRNGIDHLIEYGKNGKETENNLAFAISALIATAYLTRGSEGLPLQANVLIPSFQFSLQDLMVWGW
ncbi:hypothetical protein N7509_012718 [Penicillium cosmopolitanum]|uniref:RNase III domain-containing protein n=1 Tax=Penicillium cosmopolitanum TaxID=1131564 RepID=A0A9W9VG75_9EURO|nr:uncharacterized protein N7509_012718 [Penicillium cosmopolitanum]KAJ5379599.1 hypothetical protein N7509_012718 [Penicillium cosmopolitanum]